MTVPPLTPAERAAKVLMPVAAALALFPFVSGAWALLGGLLLALSLGNPYQDLTRRWTHTLLAASVVGLGAGMDLRVVARAGIQGLGYTVISIGSTLLLGLWLARRLGVRKDAGLLVTVGTAICGGSAIAAVAPVLDAEEQDVSMALGTVFLLNAVALFVFPSLGRLMGLGQGQFGLWAALAIHDTSSVVGAGMAYGAEALRLATTIKLARALWIVPMALSIGFLRHRGASHEGPRPSAKKPWFILGFLLAAALATYVPALREPGRLVSHAAKQGLVLTLFLIGANLSRDALRRVGPRPFLQGLALWLLVSSLSLAAIRAHLLG